MSRRPIDQAKPADVVASPELPLAEEEGKGRDEESVTVEELVNTRVYVASRRPQLLRETPGIVSIITREEIASSGARTAGWSAMRRSRSRVHGGTPVPERVGEIDQHRDVDRPLRDQPAPVGRQPAHGARVQRDVARLRAHREAGHGVQFGQARLGRAATLVCALELGSAPAGSGWPR